MRVIVLTAATLVCFAANSLLTRAALDAGRPIGVHGMDGRSRRYALGGNGAKGRSVLAIVFHDRCDMVVATAVVAGDEPAGHENAVIEFLNSEEVQRWAEVTLGL